MKAFLMIILPPLVLLPLLGIDDEEPDIGRTAYMMGIMAAYWTSEALPIAVTSLLPVVMLPLMGVLPAEHVCQQYFKDNNFLFFGGLVVAASLEAVHMHQRIALRVLLLFGTRPHQLLFGFMVGTAFLSMWMNNTATTAMMMPIAEAVLGQLESIAESDGASTTNARLIKYLGKALMLGVAWAANIGGMATLTGTGPNIVLAGGYDALFPESEPLSFATWIGFAAPISALLVLAAWAMLMLAYVPRSTRQAYDADYTRMVIARQYSELGPISWRELQVFCAFVTLALAWITRHPGFCSGWDVFFEPGYVTDGTTAVTITVLLFALPGEPPKWCLWLHSWGTRAVEHVRSLWSPAQTIPAESEEVEVGSVNLQIRKRKPQGLADGMQRSDQIASDTKTEGTAVAAGEETPTRLLTWPDIQSRVPWGVLLLLGGGFALADACLVSGLSAKLGEHLEWLEPLPLTIALLMLMLITAAVTSVASNVATASIFVPVVATLAQSMEVHPLYLLIPVTLTTSLAFVLPVSTPPNALAFASGRLTVVDMAPLGFALGLVGVALVILATNTTGTLFFGLGEFPAWAIPNAEPARQPDVDTHH
uniref:Citrate transporter-like domain-containing protein n=1 Tax=Chrysotila carterae TaxID=13221 RepID=A0A7S4EWX3_CHRCT